MGLDLCPVGRPKPGHEAEWNRLMRTLYAGRKESKKNFERRNQISVQPFADVGAPRVGESKKADAWALENFRRKEGENDAALLKRLHGFHVLPLIYGKCDGLPRYTHADLYGGRDETSLRGSFLIDCEKILGSTLLGRAWTHIMGPEEAVEYGQQLFSVAERAAACRPKARSQTRRPRGKRKSQQTLTFDDKIDILHAAGRWYVFWGTRGHPIHAWY